MIFAIQINSTYSKLFTLLVLTKFKDIKNNEVVPRTTYIILLQSIAHESWEKSDKYVIIR